MKKTITAIVTAVMTMAMSIVSFAEVSVPSVLPDNSDSLFDPILNFFDSILDIVAYIASVLFK